MHRHQYDKEKSRLKNSKRMKRLEKEIKMISRKMDRNGFTYGSEQWKEMKEMEMNKISKRRK